MTAPKQESTIPAPVLENLNEPVGARAAPERISGPLKKKQAKTKVPGRRKTAARNDPPKWTTGRETNPGGQPSKFDPLGEQPGSADLKEPIPGAQREVEPLHAKCNRAEDRHKDKHDEPLGGV